MTLRILVAGFSFLVALIAVVLIPAAYYGDKKQGLDEASYRHLRQCGHHLPG
jgi:hypothetical protein